MNRIDVVLLLVLAFYAFRGYRRGFIAVALDWLGLAAGVTLALWLSPEVGRWVAERYGFLAMASRVVAFLGLLMLMWVAWSLILALLSPRLPRKVQASKANRVAGAIPGLLEGGVVTALVLVALAALPLPIVPRSEIAESPLGSTMLRWGVSAQANLHRWMGDTVRDLIGFRPPPLKPGDRVELPFRASQPATDTEAEAAMLRLLNSERKKRGLATLVMDDRLKQVGRRHSRDMLARGYFAHEDPEGRGPFDRMRSAGIRFKTAGENLAFAPDVQSAHTGLMNSPGHRANILKPEYRRVGIGALRAQPYGLMFTQVFMN